MKIIISGSGIGGLVSALYLNKYGHDVVIYEKNDFAGGKVNEYKKDGYRFDTGPTLITMPFVLKNFFEDIDENINDYAELNELEKTCRYFWSDGTMFDSYSDTEKLSEEITKRFGNDELNAFKNFLEFSRKLYKISEKYFLTKEFKLRNFINADGIRYFRKFTSKKSLNTRANKFFKDKKLINVINRFATYNGSSPFLTPQLFSIIAYVEYMFKPYYVKSGIKKLADSLVELCNNRGIEINYNTSLKKIENNNDIITTVITENKSGTGKEIKNFDVLLSNFTNNSSLTGKEYLENTDWSLSGFMLLMGIEGINDKLQHHNILFSDDYEKEFNDLFIKKLPAENMTIYICITSRTDKNDAPQGHENWFVLVNAPSISNNFEWSEENKEMYKNKIIQRIKEFGADIEKKIKFCNIFCPSDFLNLYNCENGSIYGLSSNSLKTMFKRPRNRSNKYRNLFFAGGNTHPGGGVPLCILSGKIVSNIINK